ncbi:MAG: phosphoglycerate dehydrogenase [Deltaproteobacteria bacterium]|nr:phosphoglycerate dehydrogenase [Deltaproteobacteria bacterium]
MTMKILICDGLDESGLDLLRSTEGLEVDTPEQLSLEQIADRLPQYDAMIIRSRTRVTEKMLQRADRLKVIGRAGTGVDNVDLPSASDKGILVMNTPGANAMAAAEHTLALMLALARHLPQAAQSVREGRWEKKRFLGTEICEQTLGVIGLGRIGSIVADRAMGMGMEVIGFDPYITPEAATKMGVTWVALDDLLARSDFITLHTPLTKETDRIINRSAIARMKPGARIINCARGGLIDEEALYEALQEGHIAGAALDVFSSEPPVNHPLVALSNVIATPHLGASSIQAQTNVARAIATQLIDYLLRGVIRNAVNFPNIGAKAFYPLRPYLILAEKLGSLQGQLSTFVERLEVETSGPDLEGLPLEPITQTVIKGFLEPVLAEKVTPVNAPILLQRRQIELITSSTSDTGGYSGMIMVRATGKGQVSSARGTVFPGEGPRLILLNTYRLEAELEGINLIIQNLDKPGVIGLIGSTLGDFQVNIADMHLSRTPVKDRAMSIIRIDEEAPASALEKLRQHPNILSVQQVRL